MEKQWGGAKRIHDKSKQNNAVLLSTLNMWVDHDPAKRLENHDKKRQDHDRYLFTTVTKYIKLLCNNVKLRRTYVNTHLHMCIYIHIYKIKF